MAAMLTKFVWLHAPFFLYTCPFAACTLPSLPDSTATGALKPFFVCRKTLVKLELTKDSDLEIEKGQAGLP